MIDERIKSYLKDRLKKLEDLKNERRWVTSELDGEERWWTTAELSDMVCCKQTLEFIDSLQEESVSEELEEAAYYNCIDRLSKESIEDFKAGAKWQKEQIMAKAIDAHCFGFQGAALFSFRLPADNYLVGSEVKIIVVKED